MVVMQIGLFHIKYENYGLLLALYKEDKYYPIH